VSRRAAALAAVVLLLVLVAAALVLVPVDVLPGAHPVVDAGRDFTPAQLAREQEFHRALRPSAYASLVLGLVVAGVLGVTRLGSRLVGRLPGGRTGQVVLGVLAVTLIGRLLTLPLDVRSELVLREYGLSTQTWGSWALDAGKAVLVAVVPAALALLAVLALARRLPRTWWAWSAGALAALVVLGSFAYPVVVEPLFHSFRPLAAGPLRTDLLALAQEDGVPVRDVLVADASRRTTALNAYVSGFGSTRRLVVYDTLVQTASPQEVELVVAHELGHAERDDVLVGTALGALGGAAAVCVLALVLSWPALLARSGATGPDDPRVVPLVLALVAVGTLLAAPAVNLVSRRIEARADLHSLQLTGDADTFIRSEQRLAVQNLSDLEPAPLAYALFSTHPSGPERIALARSWAAAQP